MFWAAAAAEYNISYAYNWITSARRPVKELRSAFEKAWQNFPVRVVRSGYAIRSLAIK